MWQTFEIGSFSIWRICLLTKSLVAIVWWNFLNKSFEESINPQSFYFPNERVTIVEIELTVRCTCVFTIFLQKIIANTVEKKKKNREITQMKILYRNQPFVPGATKLASAKIHKILTENLLQWKNEAK